MPEKISLISVSIRQVVFIAFGVSGACALVHEVIRIRKLSAITGSSTHVFPPVPAAFIHAPVQRRKKIKIWILLFAFLFLSCTKQDEVQQYPVFGIDPLENVRLFESNSDVLSRWAEEGVKDAVLLHVSDADSLDVISRSDMGKIKGMREEDKLGKSDERKDGIYKDTDYLYAASRLGIIRKIYWILPYRYFDDIILADGKIRQFLKDRGTFSASDIDSMKMEFGCLTGKLSETDIAICSPKTLHLINEPALLSIDLRFFPIYADGLRVSKLHAAKKLFDELAFKKIKIIQVDIFFNTENGRARPSHRYIGYEFFEGIKNPQIFKAESPPELWTHRDMAENMLSGGEDTMVLKYLAEPLRNNPEDLALKMLNAIANAKAGNYDKSFNELNEMCNKDVHYCYGYIETGNVLADKKEYDEAEKFFLKALDALSGRPYVRDRYNSFLEKSGRHDKTERRGEK